MRYADCRGHAAIAVMFAALFVLSACSGKNAPETEAKYPTGAERSQVKDDIYAEPESIFGGDGLGIGGDDDGDSAQTGIGVNAYLWRATLDTISFMPLSSADPFGGAVITEWYNPPESEDERFKLNAFIMDKQLTANAINVKVFRQIRQGDNWQDAETSDKMATELENAILTRARRMRVADRRDGS
jgi:hypothetical protein